MRLARNALRRQFEFAGDFGDLGQVHDDGLVQVREPGQLLGFIEGRALIAELHVARLAVRRLPALVENDEPFTVLPQLKARVGHRDDIPQRHG